MTTAAEETATDTETVEALAPTLDLAAKTLSGDIRDWHLSRMRTYKKPWDQMSEREQRDEIDAATSSAEHLVRGVTQLVAAKGFETIAISCGALKLKDNTIKCEISARYSDANLIGIAHAGSVVMVLAKPEDFFGQRAPARATPDQPDLMDGADDGAIDGETGEVLATTTEADTAEDGAGHAATDTLADDQQRAALAEAGQGGPQTTDQAPLGPEAEANAERLKGIKPLEGSGVDPIDTSGHGAPAKRRGRRTVEERTAANARAAEAGETRQRAP